MLHSKNPPSQNSYPPLLVPVNNPLARSKLLMPGQNAQKSLNTVVQTQEFKICARLRSNNSSHAGYGIFIGNKEYTNLNNPWVTSAYLPPWPGASPNPVSGRNAQNFLKESFPFYGRDRHPPFLRWKKTFAKTSEPENKKSRGSSSKRFKQTS